MLVGLDFDNTLACYDKLFHQVAVELGWLPAEPSLSKYELRQFLRQSGQERQWTELQGMVYGPKILQAPPFPQLVCSLTEAVTSGMQLEIVSHKTQHPVIGAPHDLHQWAWRWLEEQGLLAPTGPIKADRVFFCQTRESKLTTIGERGYDYFVDDLPEVFEEAHFPRGVGKILFDPNGLHADTPQWKVLRRWPELLECIRG